MNAPRSGIVGKSERVPFTRWTFTRWRCSVYGYLILVELNPGLYAPQLVILGENQG